MSKIRRLLPKNKRVLFESIDVKKETDIIKKNNSYIRGIEDTQSSNTTDDKFNRLLNDTKAKKQKENTKAKKSIVKKTVKSDISKGIGATVGATVVGTGAILKESEVPEIAPWEKETKELIPLNEANMFQLFASGLDKVNKGKQTVQKAIKDTTTNTKFEGPFNQQPIQPKINEFAKAERLKQLNREKAILNKQLYNNTIKSDTLDGGKALRNEYNKIKESIRKRRSFQDYREPKKTIPPTQPAKQNSNDQVIEKNQNNNVKGTQYNPYHNYM